MFENIVANFAAREAATVEDVLALAKALSSEFASNGVSELSSAPQDKSLVLADLVSPAVPIEQSVNEHSVVCLCCSKEFTMLKRHLKAEHGLTEDQYRERFNLTDDHPLVAPSYSLRRAEYAKEIGLGKYARTSPSDDQIGSTV